MIFESCKMVTHHTSLQLKFTSGCLQSYAFNYVLFYEFPKNPPYTEFKFKKIALASKKYFSMRVSCNSKF
jgi:hypothetical protein